MLKEGAVQSQAQGWQIHTTGKNLVTFMLF
jgi:hypothetical protein